MLRIYHLTTLRATYHFAFGPEAETSGARDIRQKVIIRIVLSIPTTTRCCPRSLRVVGGSYVMVYAWRRYMLRAIFLREQTLGFLEHPSSVSFLFVYHRSSSTLQIEINTTKHHTTELVVYATYPRFIGHEPKHFILLCS